jgi:HEAT repeat protein
VPQGPIVRRATGILFGLGTLLVALATAASADDQIEAMLRQKRYGDAYATVAAAPAGESERRLEQVARDLLGVAIESDDSYTRWFGLRAAQPLDDASLAAHARKTLTQGDRYDRSLALDLLARLDPAGSREELLAALDSNQRSLRLRALKGLATLQDPALAPRFNEVLAKDDDPDLRAFAVRALAKTGSPEAPAGLYRAMEDSVAAVQEEAVRALVALESPGLTGVLRRRLADAPPEARVDAVRLTSFSADKALLSDLGPYLTDPDPEVRAYAAAAILAIAQRAAVR